MTSRTGKQIIKMHILPNISRSICNQTMKCGQLMEYNIKNIYLEIEYNIRNILLKNQGKNVVETLVRDLFKKTKIKHISGSAVWNFTQFIFIVYPSRRLSEYIESKLLTIKLFFHIKLFQKTKAFLVLVSLHHFLHNFWRKIFPTLYSFN